MYKLKMTKFNLEEVKEECARMFQNMNLIDTMFKFLLLYNGANINEDDFQRD